MRTPEKQPLVRREPPEEVRTKQKEGKNSKEATTDPKRTSMDPEEMEMVEMWRFIFYYKLKGVQGKSKSEYEQYWEAQHSYVHFEYDAHFEN